MMNGMFDMTPGLATVAAMQQNYDREAESQVTQQKGLADIMKMQQDMEHSAQMNPLRVQNQRLVNSGLEAELPGKAADATLKGVNARKAAATVDGEIAAANSDSDFKVMKNNLDRYQKTHEVFTNLAFKTKDLSPIERVAAARADMEAAGMNVNSPQAQQFLQEISENPLQFLALADDAKRRAAELSPAFLQAMAQVRQQGANQERVATIQSEGRVNAAEISAQARMEAARAREEAIRERTQLKQTLNQQVAYFQRLAFEEKDPTRKQAYEAEAYKALQALQSLPVRPGIDAAEATGLPAQVPQNPFAPQGGGGGQQDIAAQAKAAWGGYDPNKYDYRIGPNGKIQRKEK